MSEKRYRSSITGEYVTQEYAEEHPATTVSEAQVIKADEPENEETEGAEA